MADDPNDGVRMIVHGIWSSVAGQWDERADQVDERAADQTTALLRLGHVEAGDRVLELACGPGGTGLAAAEVVGPEGEVVLSDVAESMVDVAAARAEARGLTNTTTAVLDLEAIDQPDESFDAVVCREGLMFAVDPARAAGEILRVLRPGGRAALSVWAEREANPWLTALMDAASTVLDTPMPPPGIPGPFTLGDADLAALLTGAGFVEVEVEELSVPHRTPSFDAYWDLTTNLAGPLAALLAGLDDETRSAIADRTRAALAPFTSGDGLAIPGRCRLSTGRKAI